MRGLLPVPCQRFFGAGSLTGAQGGVALLLEFVIVKPDFETKLDSLLLLAGEPQASAAEDSLLKCQQLIAVRDAYRQSQILLHYCGVVLVAFNGRPYPPAADPCRSLPSQFLLGFSSCGLEELNPQMKKNKHKRVLK